MIVRFGFLCALASLVLATLSLAQEDPGIGVVPIAPAGPSIKITKTNYVAANGNNPPTADPEGTWSKPVDGIDWRVAWVYGTGTGKDFKATDTGEGGSHKIADKATGTWGKIGAEKLKTPLPANLHVRVELQRSENSKWVVKGVDYHSIP